MTIIGIDLGTTNSATARLKNGKPEILINKNGGRTTPSVFQLTETEKSSWARKPKILFLLSSRKQSQK